MQNNAKEILDRFGSLDKLNKAIHSKALDDIYCWETERWYTAKYWEYHEMCSSYSGITMRELYYLNKQVN